MSRNKKVTISKELNKTYAHHLRSVTHLTFFSFFFHSFYHIFFFNTVSS